MRALSATGLLTPLAALLFGAGVGALAAQDTAIVTVNVECCD
jgi:hypothetical protein